MQYASAAQVGPDLHVCASTALNPRLSSILFLVCNFRFHRPCFCTLWTFTNHRSASWSLPTPLAYGHNTVRPAARPRLGSPRPLRRAAFGSPSSCPTSSPSLPTDCKARTSTPSTSTKSLPRKDRRRALCHGLRRRSPQRFLCQLSRGPLQPQARVPALLWPVRTHMPMYAQ